MPPGTRPARLPRPAAVARPAHLRSPGFFPGFRRPDPAARVLHFMPTLLPPPDAVPHPAAGSDADLLGRFLADRSEPAFAELVRRHRPLVLRASRRVLGTGPEAG